MIHGFIGILGASNEGCSAAGPSVSRRLARGWHAARYLNIHGRPAFISVRHGRGRERILCLRRRRGLCRCAVRAVHALRGQLFVVLRRCDGDGGRQDDGMCDSDAQQPQWAREQWPAGVPCSNARGQGRAHAQISISCSTRTRGRLRLLTECHGHAPPGRDGRLCCQATRAAALSALASAESARMVGGGRWAQMGLSTRTSSRARWPARGSFSSAAMSLVRYGFTCRRPMGAGASSICDAWWPRFVPGASSLPPCLRCCVSVRLNARLTGFATLHIVTALPPLPSTTSPSTPRVGVRWPSAPLTVFSLRRLSLVFRSSFRSLPPCSALQLACHPHFWELDILFPSLLLLPSPPPPLPPPTLYIARPRP